MSGFDSRLIQRINVTFLRVAFFFGLVVTGATVVSGCYQSKPPHELVTQAQKALAKSDFKKVEQLTGRIPRTAAQWQAGQLLAGEAASKDGRFDSALQCFLNAAEDDSTVDGQLAVFSAAEVHLELGQLSDAETLYRKVLASQPQNGVTNQRMSFLLSMTNRRWEALPFFLPLIKGGNSNYRELGMAADVGRQIRQPDFLKKWQRNNPDGKLVRLALASDVFNEGEPHALGLLMDLVETAPELTSAQAMLGELLIEAGDESRFIEWHRSLPQAAEDSPDIWFVRGLWARNRADLNTASQCLWQTVIRMPLHRRGFCSLGQVLAALGDPQSQAVNDRAALFVELSQAIDKVLIVDGNNPVAVRQVAMLMEKLGRIWEACAWAVVGRDQIPSAAWHAEMFQKHAHKLNSQLPHVMCNLTASRKVQSVPGFDQLIARVESQSPATGAPKQPVAGSIRFEEIPCIAFEYYNADDPATKGVRTFEQTGGGVAIIDIDLDGAPDVFAPQGTEWKSGDRQPSPSGRYVDKLFRNVGGREFQDVTENLEGPDLGYGQGCSVGDFDNDGFPDLYVSNVGRNCLYKNMGDGTFVDVTDEAPLTDRSWTVSSVICDLNADGLPDIFDVNYLTGDDVYERICRERGCSPSIFPGSPDRLLINQGDGRFLRVENATPSQQSKGLGVVAFETDQDRRPTLFIANDQVANFFLANQPAENSHNIQLRNDAIIKGLAFNDHGLPMACMGVAIDDLDGNSLLDLFITNFQDEPNTLYLQDAPGLFTDATKKAGLQAVSIPYTGWGTQTLDADLDGLPDLVVANGHVDDGRVAGRDYHQRPQFFRNRGAQFEELNVEEIGPWFGKLHLGRGLARVDWNLDGRPDFIVSMINAPLAVMQNTSTNTGHFIRVQLHATETARDAIGARTTIEFDGKTVTRQLLAGDGYMASNERIVEFGIGESKSVDSITVNWPSGATSSALPHAVNATFIVVEGTDVGTIVEDSRVSTIRVTTTKTQQ